MKKPASYNIININNNLYLLNNPHNKKFKTCFMISDQHNHFMINFANVHNLVNAVKNSKNHWSINKLYSYNDNSGSKSTENIFEIDLMKGITMPLDEYVDLSKLTPEINHTYMPTKNNVKKVYKFMDSYYYGHNKDNPNAKDTLYNKYNEKIACFDTGNLVNNRTLASQYLFYRTGNSNLYQESKLVDADNARKMGLM